MIFNIKSSADMVKVLIKKGELPFYFPKVRENTVALHTLTLYNDFGDPIREIDVIDTKTLKDYYYFLIDFSDVPDGEYVYTIDAIERGLIIIGDLTPNKKQYSNTKETIQYEG